MKHTESEVFRSFLPEGYLKFRGDKNALWARYRFSTQYRLRSFLSGYLEAGKSTRISVGSVILDVLDTSPASCKNSVRRIASGSEITQLHFNENYFRGLQAVRRDLGRAAVLMRSYPQLFLGRPMVGVTYSELVNVVMKLGLERMEVTGCEEWQSEHIRASHRVFCALNGNRNTTQPRPFQLEAVYISPEDFMHRFEQYAP